MTTIDDITYHGADVILHLSDGRQAACGLETDDDATTYLNVTLYDLDETGGWDHATARFESIEFTGDTGGVMPGGGYDHGDLIAAATELLGVTQ